jgi:PKD repeat protein
MFTTRPKTAVIAGFSSNSPVIIGEPVQFYNTSQGTEPLSFVWDFGDGSPAIDEVNPHHVYKASGTYMVTLTVTDDAGVSGFISVPVEIVPIRIFVPLSISS